MLTDDYMQSACRSLLSQLTSRSSLLVLVSIKLLCGYHCCLNFQRLTLGLWLLGKGAEIKVVEEDGADANRPEAEESAEDSGSDGDQQAQSTPVGESSTDTFGCIASHHIVHQPASYE